MFVGYSLDHPRDCYQMWDPKTGGIRTTQDVVWLKPTYFNNPKKPKDMKFDNVIV
jgi:hypothetical protein